MCVCALMVQVEICFSCCTELVILKIKFSQVTMIPLLVDVVGLLIKFSGSHIISVSLLSVAIMCVCVCVFWYPHRADFKAIFPAPCYIAS